MRHSATDAERLLWMLLRARRVAGTKFRRQHPVGPFIADFACLASRIIVEADGGQHADNPDDARRTAWLRAHGWRVMRFWNNEILDNPEGVVAVIERALEDGTPSPSQP